MDFNNITAESIEFLEKFYKNCGYRLCEYSAGAKYMWAEDYHSAYAVSNNCLVVKEYSESRVWFSYPVAGKNGDIGAALDDIDRYCSENGIRPVFMPVPDDALCVLLKRYPYASVKRPHLFKDYFYLTENFASFKGRKFSGQRNHINKFRKKYPDAEFRLLSDDDDALIGEFWAEFEKQFDKNSKLAVSELKASKKMLKQRRFFRSAAMFCGGKIIGLCLGEKCGDTMIVHIEKALYSYEGVYPAIVNEFANLCAEDTVYSNREDDAGDKGLRISKLQYKPLELLSKHIVTAGSELDSIKEIPELRTDRLTLDAITQNDAGAYNALCLDDELNKYWGYDYKDDLNGELTDDYFVSVAEKDFDNSLAVNFAVRLDGKFIGEAVLYNIDYKGAAELGCRISREYHGNGYGAEAFAAAADWALYGAGFEKVVAKCFRENSASYCMLSTCMREIGEDETFFYFEKTS